jgi:hypothetical protein
VEKPGGEVGGVFDVIAPALLSVKLEVKRTSNQPHIPKLRTYLAGRFVLDAQDGTNFGMFT